MFIPESIRPVPFGPGPGLKYQFGRIHQQNLLTFNSAPAYMTGYAGSRDYVARDSAVSAKDPTPIPLKNRLRPSRFRYCAGCEPFEVTSIPQKNPNETFGICFSVGSVLGLLRRLSGPYIIPGPGVPCHMYNNIGSWVDLF